VCVEDDAFNAAIGPDTIYWHCLDPRAKASLS
jgi:hypothetical protein